MTKILKQLPGLPVERALGIISGRWKTIILNVLLGGPKRACELEKLIPPISQKVLFQQLRALEAHGLLERKSFADDAQRVDYVLTPLGVSVGPIIAQLEDWGRQHAEKLADAQNLLPCEA